MAVLKRQFRISQSGLESCPWTMEAPCHHSRQAPSPYSAFHARWLAQRSLCQATAGARKRTRGCNSACEWDGKVLGRYRLPLVTVQPSSPHLVTLSLGSL